MWNSPGGFLKAAEAGNVERQTAEEKCEENQRIISKEIKDLEAAKKVALDSASKVADAYDAKLYKFKDSQWRYLLITL